MPKSGITKDEIVAWGGPEVFNQGLALCNSGDVTDVAYDDETLEISGKIDRGDGWAMPVSLKLEAKGRITSHCPCYTNQKLGQVCPHITAIAIARMVIEMDESEDDEGTAPDGGQNEEEARAEDGDFIEVPAKPGFYAFVAGSRASLSIALDAWYGEIDFPACSLQQKRIVFLPDPDDDMVRRVRSMESEREALRELEKRGFEPGYRENDMKLYLVNPQKVMDFLGAGLPALRRRGWRIDLSENLEKIVDSIPSVLPVVRIKDAPGGAFDVSYAFEAGGREIPPAEIQAALNRGDGCILRDDGPVLLDNAAIETMHDVFRDTASSQNGAGAGWFRVGAVHAPYVAFSPATLSTSTLPPQRRMSKTPPLYPGKAQTRSNESLSENSAKSCGRTREPASTGCGISRIRLSTVFSPTKWAWARRSRRLHGFPCRARAQDRRSPRSSSRRRRSLETGKRRRGNSLRTSRLSSYRAPGARNFSARYLPRISSSRHTPFSSATSNRHTWTGISRRS